MLLSGKQQKKEIKTIKERVITVRLSDADCERLVDLCGRYNMSIGELLENFIGDLVDGTYSNGSDERHLAEQWFERCWFSTQPKQTLLNHLLSWGYEPEDYLEMLDDIKVLQAEKKYVIDHPEEYMYPDEEKRSLREGITDLKAALDSMREDWYPDGKVCMSGEVKRIRRWKEEKAALLAGKEAGSDFQIAE